MTHLSHDQADSEIDEVLEPDPSDDAQAPPADELEVFRQESARNNADSEIDEVLESDPSDDAQAPPADELEVLRQESARNFAGWQRAQADYENLKRRSAKDVRDRVHQSQRSILLALLDLADDFERANREAPPEDADADDPWRLGVNLISQKLNALLVRHQVQQIDTVDQPFDPDFHDAVGQLPGQANEIVEVVLTGYTIDGSVLRYSKVIVGDGTIEPPDSTDQPTAQDTE